MAASDADIHHADGQWTDDLRDKQAKYAMAVVAVVHGPPKCDSFFFSSAEEILQQPYIAA
jgi:hypothetical protein